jgi:Flp pilus assembly protein TadD
MVPVLLAVLAATPLEQAQALEASGDDRAAVSTLERAVFSDPAWGMGRVELGRLQLKLGDSEFAFNHLDIARSLSPENPRAHYLYALAAAETGRRTESRRSLEVSLTLREGYADAQVRLASLLFAEGDYARAASTLKPYVAAHADATGARLQLADALERSGDKKAAEHELRTLFEKPAVRQLAGRRLIALLDSEGRGADADKIRHLIDPPRRQLRDLKPSGR